jgi:hypothetical protein
MSTQLGPLIGEGRTAEVYAYGEGVIKLLRPGFDPAILHLEAAKTRAAVTAGAPAPKVKGEVELDGRLGAVFDRIEGPVLVEKILRQPHRIAHWAATLAETQHSILERTTSLLPDVREVLARKIRSVEVLSPHQRDQALGSLKGLPGGSSVLHGDLHPLNIHLTTEGPMVIDWLDAARGHPAADIARSLWLSSSHAIPHDFPGWRLAVLLTRAFRRTYLKTILSLTGLSNEDLEPWRLPVLAARLSEGIEHEQRPLLEEVARLSA